MRKTSTILIAVVLMISCRKENEYADKATIVGPDPRTAPCTGGIYILIDGHPNPNHSNGYYDINDIPTSI